ncbi:MAG: hypothetical protein LBD51_07860 [Bifidobacteriaceae bacterium]|jgi:hypothetical protein|nr:hypothetical protein [Bifidobacteriaceae bacterium]
MYTSDAQYSGHVKGSDIKAKLSIAAKGANLFANNDVAQYVKVKFLLDGAQGTPAEVFLEGTIDAPEDFLGDDANDKVSVDVFIEFDPATPDQVAQAVADAVNFNQGLDLVLEQVAA